MDILRRSCMLITPGNLTKPFWGRELHIIIQLNSGGSKFSLKSFRSLQCNNYQNWWDMDLQWLSAQPNGCDAGWDFQNSFSYRVNCNHLNHHRFRGNSKLVDTFNLICFWILFLIYTSESKLWLPHPNTSCWFSPIYPISNNFVSLYLLRSLGSSS